MEGEGEEGKGWEEREKVEDGMEREGARSAPKLKLGPQNYFPGAGADYRPSIADICRSS